MSSSHSDAFTPEEYISKDLGKVVSFSAVKNDPEGFSEAFCEGSPSLKRLLKHLWNKDVETFGCCVGHKPIYEYTKDTLFGSKAIDKETYEKHAASKRYHAACLNPVSFAYVGINVKSIGFTREVCRKIEDDVQRIAPQLPFDIYYGKNVISFNLGRYVPPSEAELFFKVLGSVLDRNIPYLAAAPPAKQQGTRKPALNDQIQNATTKAVAQTTKPVVPGRSVGR